MTYVLLAIPMIAIAGLGGMVLYLPLSYVYPEFVKWWVLEVPPPIWWRADNEALIANFLSIVSIVVLAPVIEEFLFRGFLLNRWLRKYGIKTAVILPSILFALIHTEIIGGFVFGVVLSLIYIKTQSIFGPIIVHLSNNAMVLFIVIIGKILENEPYEPNISEFQ